MNQPKAHIDLSIILITLNEGKRLRDCLSRLPKGAEIIVVDSGSSDETIKIAETFEAKVVVRTFDNYANQRNASLEHATRNWVFWVDPDEVVSQELATKIEAMVEKKASPNIAYRIRRKLVFMEKTLNFGKSSDRPLRLFMRQKGSFVGDIHETVVLQPGKVETLNGELYHYSYESLTDYFSRFNRYTSAIAQRNCSAGRTVTLIEATLRPIWEFFYRYVFRAGFLDGYPGFVYAALSSFYVFVKLVKTKENATLS
jgi:glycosyltransferase involved in cell wall biosynthesis